MESVLNLPQAENSGCVRTFMRRLGRALLEPRRFFRSDFSTMETPALLAFGLGNAWAASIAAFFVQTINSLLLSKLLDRWMQHLLSSEDGFAVWNLTGSEFLYSSGLTLLGPFLFLLQITIGGFVLFLFARLLIDDREAAAESVTFTGILKIQSASLVSEWYTLVPIFGGLLAFIARIILLVTGVRERYSVSTRRATAVVLAPYVLVVVGLGCLVAISLLVLTQIPLQDLINVDTDTLGF